MFEQLYDFADEEVWPNARLLGTARNVAKLLKEHVTNQTAPEEFLIDLDEGLEQMTFEIWSRKRETVAVQAA